MKSKFEYKFDSSNNIFFKNYINEVTIADIKSSWGYIFENKLIPPETKRFVLNYKNASFKMNTNDYLKIADFYKNNLNIFRDSKIAVITEKPTDIVIPFLVETKDDGYISKPFSTMAAAIKWVLS